MRERCILSKMLPSHEKLIYAPSKGRPKIVDAIWTLYPSQELVDEIIGGNKKMDQARSQIGGNKRESRLLPGFEDQPGEIGAKGSEATKSDRGK